MFWRYVVIAVAGYLLGNISMGIIISGRYHMDIREHGSGNAGTTNVLRTLGWLPSALTLVGDALKSFAASMLGQWLAGAPGLLLGGFMAVVGHNWPVFNGFRGGKGMAASLVTSVAFPIVMAILYRDSPDVWMYVIYAVLLAAVTIFSHRANIQRLMRGTENRINFKKIKVKPDEKTKG